MDSRPTYSLINGKNYSPYLFLLAGFLVSHGILRASVIHVDAANPKKLQLGTAKNPFGFLQEAIDRAGEGDTIKVARGTYFGNVFILSKTLILLGGYRGGTSAQYKAGNAGDFETRDFLRFVSTVKGTISLTESDGKWEGFTVTDGNPGIRISGNSGAQIVRCKIEHCGVPERKARGGGISVEGPSYKSVVVSNCIMRNNVSGRGGGIFTSDSTHVTIQDCLVENNTGYDNHGGGICVTGDASILRNVVRGNVIGAGEGFATSYGSGFISQGTNTFVYSAYNIIYDNLAKKPGGAAAVLYDEGTKALIEHDIIFKNRNEGQRVSGLQIDGGGDYNNFARTSAIVRNCTVADNMNAGVWVEHLADVGFENCIFWNNGNNEDFRVKDSSTSTLTIRYCFSSQDLSTLPYLRSATGNVHGIDPLFADAAAGDYHLRSTIGRWDPTLSKWVKDTALSPAIDGGDPASQFANEPLPNGGRTDAGAFGNTLFSSKSAK